MRVLYGVPVSPFVRKVRFALAFKGLEYRLEPVIPMAAPPEYREKSPLGKIPCYEDEDVTLPDSSVICAYLERIAPEPALFPADPAAFGRTLWFEEYADTKLVDEINPIFFERFMRARIHNEKPDESVVERQWKEHLPPVFDYLESELEGGGMLVGEFTTLADLSVASALTGLLLLGFDIPEDRWPNLQAFFLRQLETPSIAAIVAEERAAWDSLGR